MSAAEYEIIQGDRCFSSTYRNAEYPLFVIREVAHVYAMCLPFFQALFARLSARNFRLTGGGHLFGTCLELVDKLPSIVIVISARLHLSPSGPMALLFIASGRIRTGMALVAGFFALGYFARQAITLVKANCHQHRITQGPHVVRRHLSLAE